MTIAKAKENYWDLPIWLRTRPPLTEVSRALRARNAEKVSKMSPGASGPGTPKSLQKVSGQSEKSPESVERVFSDCSRDFLEAFRDIFETFSAFRARRARKSPFLLCPLKVFSTKHVKGPENLKGAEKKRTLQKHPFGQPFLRTTLRRSFGAPPKLINFISVAAVVAYACST